MKIRLGFVANSSSSSFVCEICGRSESGFDASIKDFDMINCVNYHTFCIDEAVEDIQYSEDVDEYSVPEKYCPICSFLTFSNLDLSKYLLKITGIPRDEVFADVKKLNPRRKKLYDNEYIMYACTKGNIDKDALMTEVKQKFETYAAFKKYIDSK